MIQDHPGLHSETLSQNNKVKQQTNIWYLLNEKTRILFKTHI